MRAVRAWLRRLLGALATDRAERELSAELESHLQLHIDDNLRAGMTPAEARRRALIALGGLEQAKEQYRERRGLPVVRVAAPRSPLRRPHAGARARASRSPAC